MMNTFEEKLYMNLVCEFENKLRRKLAIEEKGFLKWLAKNYS